MVTLPATGPASVLIWNILTIFEGIMLSEHCWLENVLIMPII